MIDLQQIVRSHGTAKLLWPSRVSMSEHEKAVQIGRAVTEYSDAKTQVAQLRSRIGELESTFIEAVAKKDSLRETLATLGLGNIE